MPTKQLEILLEGFQSDLNFWSSSPLILQVASLVNFWICVDVIRLHNYQEYELNKKINDLETCLLETIPKADWGVLLIKLQHGFHEGPLEYFKDLLERKNREASCPPNTEF